MDVKSIRRKRLAHAEAKVKYAMIPYNFCWNKREAKLRRDAKLSGTQRIDRNNERPEEQRATTCCSS